MREHTLPAAAPGYNQTVISGKEVGSSGGGWRVLAFALGGALALASFALLSWDLANHWVPYSPSRPSRSASSPLRNVLAYYWVLHSAFLIWRKHRSKTAQRDRQPENAGSILPHPSESGDRR